MVNENLTRYERARLIGARALQIAMGASPMATVNSDNPIDMATAELEQDVIPIAIRQQTK